MKSSSSVADTTPSGRSLVGVVALYLAALHAATLLASRSDSALLWGLNFWRGLAFWPVLGLFCLPVFIFGLGEALHSRLPLAGERRSWVPLAPIAMLVIAPGVFWFWRDATHLMGDGILILLRTARGIVVSDSSPLGNALRVRIAAPFLNATVVEPSNVLASGVEIPLVLISIACGVIFVGLTWLLWGELTSCLSDRWTGTLLFLLNPTLVVFFGYAEFYSLSSVSALLTSWLALLAIGGRVPPWTATAAFTIGLGAHASLMLYCPLIVGAYWMRRLSARRALADVVGGCLLGLALLWVCGVSPQRLLTVITVGERYGTLSIAAHDPSVEAYGLFGFAHLIDFANEMLLVMPLVFFIPLFAGQIASQGLTRLLAGTALVMLAAMVVINPRLGFARDWDLMAFPALLANMLAIALLLGSKAQTRPDCPRRRRFLLFIVGVSLARTVAWIDLHHNPGRLLVRADAMAVEARLSSTSARRHLRDDMATYFESRGDLGRAYREIREAAAIEPTHAWTAFRVADLAHKVGDEATEFEALRRTVELDSALTAAWGELGRAYLDRSELASAEDCFNRVLSDAPTDLKAHVGLAITKSRRGDTDGALTEARLIADLVTEPRRHAALSFLATAIENDGHADAGAQIRRLAE